MRHRKVFERAEILKGMRTSVADDGESLTVKCVGVKKQNDKRVRDN
jgi:hypothetical protein